MFSDSDGYQRFMGRWSRLLAPLLLDYAGIGVGQAVLDVGCGTGALAHAAARIPDVHVTGIDPSDEFLRVARAGDGADTMRFVSGGAEELPFPTDSFDRTISMLVLNFVDDPVRALAEMVRVTRPGGVVASAVWDYGDGMGMLRTFWDAARDIAPQAGTRDERHMPLSRSGELTDLWRTAGLREVEEKSLSISTAFDSFDDYWQPFGFGQGPAGAMARALSDDQRADLRSRLHQRLIGDGPDRPFTLPARAWAVRGTC
ncbi:class I SAM-dependent methyltransferase [Gordonia sp. CPCC 205515]|uniref:class I SAM-dependent methyltransferase n=1 Tax=Gordonia sp. CPCC 205515 TaxID=3140791 RepID=UPI003AF34E20